MAMLQNDVNEREPYEVLPYLLCCEEVEVADDVSLLLTHFL